MDPRPLVIDEIDAGSELVRDFDKFMPVKAAFWLYPSSNDRWLLYIASEDIDGSSIRRGYREIWRLTNAMQNPNLDLFQIKLIGANHPLATAVLKLHERHSGTQPIRIGEATLGRMGINAAYLYPLLASCP